MLKYIQKSEKRLLISVDEVTNSEYIRIFASSFQIFLRNDYPIFLLMTGLYENIYNLQNDKVLTFLYRAPKLILEPLNYTAIRKQYMDIFSLDIDAAGELASLTKGYPFAFQVLGYLYWENRDKKTLEQILPEYEDADTLLDAGDIHMRNWPPGHNYLQTPQYPSPHNQSDAPASDPTILPAYSHWYPA